MPCTVTMVGVSNTGKTCLIYGMYHAMMEGINGIKFIPKDRQIQMLLQEKWRNLCLGELPPGTIQSNDYQFNCFLRGNVIGNFECHDVRGGILTENQTLAQANNFYLKCEQSQCLVVCIPADMLLLLLDQTKKNTVEYLDSIEAMNRYKTETTNARLKNPSLPVVLTITKGDLMKGSQFDAVCDYLKNQFDTLFSKTGGAVGIVRVSIGKIPAESGQGQKFHCEIQPRNVHIPFLLPVFLSLQKQLVETGDNIEHNQQGRERRKREIEAEQRRNPISKFIFGSTEAELRADSNRLAKEIKELHEVRDELKEIMDALSKEFSKHIFYFNGKRI